MADVGGGQDSTLAAILRASPSLHGILVDQPQVVAGVPPVLRAAGVIDRCEVLDGDILQGVPRGADAYVVKRVLMIWGDELAIQVLRHCAEALSENGRVLVMEMVMPRGNDQSPARNFDLLMLLANQEGRVRDRSRVPRPVCGCRAASRPCHSDCVSELHPQGRLGVASLWCDPPRR